MEALRIRGLVPLMGTVPTSGAKNAALPIMAASLLAEGPVLLERVPCVADVATLVRLLAHLGVTAQRPAPNTLVLDAPDDGPVRAPARWVERMRASFCVLGPLLARRGRAVVPLPGGCRIGPRPVDLHLQGLAALGADLSIRQGRVVARARRLRGATIDLAGPRGSTVTGTANVLSAAVRARGTTIIQHAATEPEITCLVQFLTRLGARIEGAGTSTLIVDGVEFLAGARHTIIPDRIEAGTLLMAAAITGGTVTVTHCQPAQLAPLLAQLTRAGASVRAAGDHVTVSAPERLRAMDWCAQPHPGLPTDLQAPWMALAAVSHGACLIQDCVFPTRFGQAPSLARMGAVLRPTAGGYRVRGVARLRGTRLTAGDLRAGAALILAALAAGGTSHVRGLQHVDRGYEQLDAKLRAVGADIQRVMTREPRTGLTSPAAWRLARAGYNDLVSLSA